MLIIFIQLLVLGFIFDVSINLRRMNKKLDAVSNKKS